MSFNETMQDIVNLSTEEKVQACAKSYFALRDIFEQIDPETHGMVVLYALLGTTVISDGKLSEEEYTFMDGMLSAIGQERSHDEIMELVKLAADNPDGAYGVVKFVRNQLDDDGITDLVTFVACLCAIDDRIAANEVNLIKSLL